MPFFLLIYTFSSIFSFQTNSRKKRDVSSTRLIRERQHFSRNVMVSVAISKMGKSRIVFIEPGAKVNSQYYCRNVLGDGLLPDIRANTTLGPYSRTALHHTPLRTLWSICDVRTFLSLSLTCGPQTART